MSWQNKTMNEPIWLTMGIIETIQFDLIKMHGGHPGYRDQALVEAALARPKNRLNDNLDSDIFTLAASYGFGLAKNHGFIDGNKRVALMAMYIFLYLNGYELDAPEYEVVAVIMNLSSGELDETGLADWLRQAATQVKI